jgi:branched-subunit amino acid ABC-type transport system permease component
MPAPRGKLTDLPDISAYVLAHAAGIAWGFAVNPMIFRSLVAQGYRDHLQLAAIALGIAVSAVVLLIFLLLRKAMAGSDAPPPPADLPAPPARFTDLREIAAYVLAHAAGIAWGATVNPMIFRSLIAQGHRNLMLPGLAISIAVSIVVLLIFLFLRKAMAGPREPT